ncbi:MAG: phosphatase PAP2 family protein [Gaiellaceae bacterium]
MDRSLQRWIVEHRADPLDPLFELLSHVGSFGLVWLGLALAFSLTHSGDSWRRPWLLRPWLLVRVAVTIMAAELVSGLLKMSLSRDRPPLAEPEPMPLVPLPATHSFPSGHATVSFACATVLALAVPRLRWPLFALAALIGVSRIYVGVHYPGDVLAGALLGVGLGLLVRVSGRPLRRLANLPAVPRVPPRPPAGPRR